MSASLPVLALTILGVLIVVLGLFAGGVELMVIGLVALAVAGVLSVLEGRRTS